MGAAGDDTLRNEGKVLLILCHDFTLAGSLAPRCHSLTRPPVDWGRESEE